MNVGEFGGAFAIGAIMALGALSLGFYFGRMTR